MLNKRQFNKRNESDHLAYEYFTPTNSESIISYTEDLVI